MAWRNLARWKSVVKEAFEGTTLVAKFLCGLHFTDTYICTPTVVFGPSMFPTLNPMGDVLLVERISTRLGLVGPGDVVLVQSPENPKKYLTKRILGMEGDRVNVPGDPYTTASSASIQVPKGHVWIQGDNTYVSIDSRHYGPVPYGLVKGKVFCRVWPPEGFGSLRHGVWQ